MNYADLKRQIKILLVDPDQAGAMCGKRTVFQDLCVRYNLKPVVRKKSVCLYSVKEIENAVARLEMEAR